MHADAATLPDRRPHRAQPARSMRWRSAGRQTLATAAAMARSSCGRGHPPADRRPLTATPTRSMRVAFSTGRQTLATGSDDALPGLWSDGHPPAGRSAPSSAAQCGRGFCSGLHPDGKTLATGNGDGTARLREWPPISRSASVTPAPLVRSLRWRSPRTAKTLATGNGDGTLQLWDGAITSRSAIPAFRRHAFPSGLRLPPEVPLTRLPAQIAAASSAAT